MEFDALVGSPRMKDSAAAYSGGEDS